jgi:hypothetical protein
VAVEDLCRADLDGARYYRTGTGAGCWRHRHEKRMVLFFRPFRTQPPMACAGGRTMSSLRDGFESPRVDIVAVVVLALVALLAPGAAAQPMDKLPLHLLAHAINLGTSTATGIQIGPGTALVEITITRWSTSQERARFVAALAQKGQEGLLEAFQKAPSAGTIRTPDKLGWDLHYAHQVRTADGGRRIIVATDRRISFWEQVNRPASINYPFTLAEIHLDPSGKGEGKLSLATQIQASPDKGFIELVDYATQPVHLADVQVEK